MTTNTKILLQNFPLWKSFLTTNHLFHTRFLNWNEDKKLYYAPVKRIIRHKVSKPKWKLKTKSGEEIIVTNDHSMIVFRDNKKIEVKPSEILKTDKILSVRKI